MLKNNNPLKIIFIVLAVIAVGALGYFGYSKYIEKPPQNPPAEQGRPVIGVISYAELAPLHPDYKNLEEIDKQLSQLGDNPFDPAQLKKLNDSLGKKMMTYQNQIRGLLQAEQENIQASSRTRVMALQAQLRSAYDRKRADFMQYQAQLEKEYKVKQEDPNRKMTDWEKEFTARVKKNSQDIIMLRERQVAAKSLELQKRSQEKLLVHKNRMEKLIAECEDEIRSKSQNQKLDLQLKAQVAKDDEEREAVQKQIEALVKSEQDAVAERRKQLSAEFSTYDNAEKSKNEAELKKYAAKLDADLGNQLEGIKQKVANQMYAEGRKKGAPQPMPGIPDEMRQKLQARQKQMQDEMTALQSKVQAQVRDIEASSRASFESRKNELMGRLETYHKALGVEFEKKKNKMISEIQSAGNEQQKARMKLVEQRKALYDRIVADINSKVADIAKQKNIDIVIGEYEVNINAVDITNEAKEAMQTIK